MPKKWVAYDSHSRKIIEVFDSEERALIFKSAKFPRIPRIKVASLKKALRENIQFPQFEEESGEEGGGLSDMLGDLAEGLQYSPLSRPEVPEKEEGEGILPKLSRTGERMEELDLTDILSGSEMDFNLVDSTSDKLGDHLKKILKGE